jgi:hypothetical protein
MTSMSTTSPTTHPRPRGKALIDGRGTTTNDQANGIDDELSSAARVAITVTTQMADPLARAREEAARTAQGRSEHEVKQLQQRLSAERDVGVAKVSVVERPEFWERSSLLEQASMHETAQQWKDVDPRAQAASETIGRELRERCGSAAGSTSPTRRRTPMPCAPPSSSASVPRPRRHRTPRPNEWPVPWALVLASSA